jgi:hypothetical protein
LVNLHPATWESPDCRVLFFWNLLAALQIHFEKPIYGAPSAENCHFFPSTQKFEVLENSRTVFDFRSSPTASLHQHLREEQKAMKTRVLEKVGVQRLEKD